MMEWIRSTGVFRSTGIFKGMVLCACLFLPARQALAQPIQVGTTFSQKQCAYLGLDWKETYAQILQLDLTIIRLGAYWDEIQKEREEYNFRSLDWQIAKARGRGIPVILTIGMKSPRWPEYHIPFWLAQGLRLLPGQDVSSEPLLQKEVIEFIRRVVERYKDEEIIHYWQVENEPFNNAGPGDWWIGTALVEKEIALVKVLDPRHRPIVVNVLAHPNPFLRFLRKVATQHDPIAQALGSCDIFAVNVYPVIGHRLLGFPTYYRSEPQERIRYLKGILELAQKRGRPVWVTELQAEPWEPGQLVYVGKEHPPTGLPEHLRSYVQELVDLNVRTILLWGAEYWYYRKVQHEDSRWWEEASRLLKWVRNESDRGCYWMKID